MNLRVTPVPTQLPSTALAPESVEIGPVRLPGPRDEAGQQEQQQERPTGGKGRAASGHPRRTPLRTQPHGRTYPSRRPSNGRRGSY